MVPPKQRAEICFQVWLLGKQKSDSTSCRWGPGQCRNRERIQKFRKQVMEMETKSPKHTNKRHVLATTTRKPGDFSFGSPESRAIARSILQPANQLPLLSQEELDCLRLYSGESYLNVTTRPDCKDLERTPAYAHGKEIHLLLCGPTVPYHLNAKAKRSSLASISFGAAFGREPRAGDILRFEDVQRAAIGKRHSVENFIRAWKRQLPEMPCPLRVDGERIFCRVKRNQNSYLRPPSVPADDGFYWAEASEFSAQEKWRRVELHAFDAYAKEHGIRQLGTLPHCPAVVFLGVVDGEHRCRPQVSDAERD